MLISDLDRVMRDIAPLEYAEPWDKVGLLVGDSARELRGPIVLAIDLTERVLDEAVALQAGAIVAYHPPIFEPLSRITDSTPRQRVVLRAVESKIAIYSPHTALDAVPGGVTDWLCEGLSASTVEGKIAGDCRALSPHARRAPTQEVKITTFVPKEKLDEVRDALASAGAGIIGNYTRCSFSAAGTGTFLGDESSTPAAGVRGRLEHVEECRLEMVCSKAAVALAVETLRRFHPYEEPAIDVYELVPLPRRSAGTGRRLVLDRPATVPELAARLKGFIRRDRVRYALAPQHSPSHPLTHVGVVPGSGESFSRLARAEACEVFVTGEMKHHEVLGALNSGMSVILGGHTPTERGYLPRLKKLMEARITDGKIVVSTADMDPLTTA